eukprot:Nk52_evm25s1763 gene=Nk52_evmTU25s1763
MDEQRGNGEGIKGLLVMTKLTRPSLCSVSSPERRRALFVYIGGAFALVSLVLIVLTGIAIISNGLSKDKKVFTSPIRFNVKEWGVSWTNEVSIESRGGTEKEEGEPFDARKEVVNPQTCKAKGASSSQPDSVNIIFACLGPLAFSKHQGYVWKAVEQARLWNPQADVYMIISRDALTGGGEDEIFRNANLSKVRIAIYDDFVETSELSGKFREAFHIQGDMVPDGNTDFVRLTSERMFSVNSLIQACGLKDTFHLENDNMLYVDLQKELMPSLVSCETGFAIPRAANEYMMVSFVYIRDAESFKPLLSFIVEAYDSTKKGNNTIMDSQSGFVNDMTIPVKFYEMIVVPRGEKQFQEFPAWIHSPNGDRNFERESECLWKEQGFLYDAAVLGQFYAGTYAKPTESHWEENRLMDPRQIPLEWRSESDTHPGLHRPFVDGHLVVNLHVHSKNLQGWSSLETKPALVTPQK